MPALLAFVLWLSLTASAKEIALTFDDAPRSSSARFEGATRAQELLARLREARVDRAVFFVNTAKMDDEGTARIEAYAAAGHGIANHSHSHPDINAVDAGAYITDVKRAHERLMTLSAFAPLFRFPFLREGGEASKRDAVRAALADLGYRNGYVTVNNYDWYMDRLYQQALHDGRSVDEARLRDVYVAVLVACVEWYDTLAVDVIGRSPRHVLLLHENDLAAMFVDDLVAALRAKGWSIVTPERAYEDEIASITTTRPLKYNPGRIGEIAKDRGYEGPLWHESCDEAWLEKRFGEAGVFGP